MKQILIIGALLTLGLAGCASSQSHCDAYGNKAG